MAKIKVMDKHLAELIAAGEVVERPASVVKELVENAIDAGATAVTVEIKNGGVTFIRIADNGAGILREDVSTAFLRHATSKITKQEDLLSIGTLGFRGEALASISAVARVELFTRTEEELAGTRYVIEGGEEKIYTDAGCPRGTTILVRDLFYNTPARMKFLKKDVTEANAVSGVLDKIALSHPEISFRYLRDGKEVLYTPGDGRVKSAVFSVLGKQFIESAMPVEYELNGVKVNGFAGRPAAARPNRSFQTFFLNGRYVRMKTAVAALEEAYKGAIMVGKYPVCVLYVQVEPETVDVNVHPAKLEVRFVNEKPIFDAVYYAVKSALATEDRPSSFVVPASQRTNPVLLPTEAKPPVRTLDQLVLKSQASSSPLQGETRPVVLKNIDNKSNDAKISAGQSIQTDRPVFLSDAGSPVYQISRTIPEEEVAPAAMEPISNPGEEGPASAPVQPSSLPAESLILVGEAFQTYLILQAGDNDLIFIDKHAAHERILYEKFRKESGSAYQQFLLEPLPVALEKHEYDLAVQSKELLAQAGFEIDDFGLGTILIRACPLYLEGRDISAAIIEIIGYLAEHKKDLSPQLLDWIYHNIACRAAIKAGDKTSPEELMALARQLHDHPEIRYCPHGRPIYLAFSKKELEKQFGRI